MKTTIGITVLVAGLAAGSEAAAQYCELERLRVQAQGEVVSADFSSVDTSTCALGIETRVHVEGSQGFVAYADHCGRGADHTHTDTTVPANVVAVAVAVFDHCLGTRVFLATGIGEPEELHVNSNFKTASLRAAVEGLDVSGQPVTFAIDLVWSGVGSKERTVDNVHDTEGIIQLLSTSTGTIRNAMASGTVAVEGSDTTPLPSTTGMIAKDAAHQLLVYR